jgi:hypothetical protein
MKGGLCFYYKKVQYAQVTHGGGAGVMAGASCGGACCHSDKIRPPIPPWIASTLNQF